MKRITVLQSKSFFIAFAVISFTMTLACSQKKETKSSQVLVSIKTETTLDSNAVNEFISKYSTDETFQMNTLNFYRKRNFSYAWIGDDGLNEYAHNFMNLLQQEKASKKMHYRRLDSISTIFDKKDYKNVPDSINRQLLEIEFTITFFEYAKNNWSGLDKNESREIDWFIQKDKLKYDDLLSDILSKKPNIIVAFEPYNRQYALLKKKLLQYREIEKKNDFIHSNDSLPKIELGSTSAYIKKVKRQLFELEDLSIKDENDTFNTVLSNAIKKYQHRNGLTATGELNSKTIAALKRPMHELIQQIIINMERCKWVPQSETKDYVLVNIPAYKLYVYHLQKLEWSCNVVVGKSKIPNNTTIFNDQIEYIVFSPYWNVTQNIIVKELLPTLKRKPNYLNQLQMEVIDLNGKHISNSRINWKSYNSSFPYIIRQKPGKNNSLGKVKFIFPNQYNIYLHDTPQRFLFNEQNRDFSHGCIRVEKPFELTKFLMRDMPLYTDSLIIQLMNRGKEKTVRLHSKAPIYIVYFTAWVSNEGELNFRDDIYNHDAKMKTLLFGK
jgi:murein L,D-transpeptidase YcbB/YkuD